MLISKALRFLILFTLAGIGMPGTPAAEPLKIGVMHFAPFLIVKGHETGGTELERLKRVLNSQGITYTVVGLPPRRLYQYVAAGKVDLILSSMRNPIFENEVIQSSQPVTSIELKLYAHKKTALPKSRNEWIGKTFIIINGYGYAGLLSELQALEKKQRITVYRSRSHSNAVKMLAARRADFLLDYKMPTSIAIAELELADTLQAKTVLKVDIHVLLHRDVKNARQLLAIIEKGYRQLAE